MYVLGKCFIDLEERSWISLGKTTPVFRMGLYTSNGKADSPSRECSAVQLHAHLEGPGSDWPVNKNCDRDLRFHSGSETPTQERVNIRKKGRCVCEVKRFGKTVLTVDLPYLTSGQTTPLTRLLAPQMQHVQNGLIPCLHYSLNLPWTKLSLYPC